MLPVFVVVFSALCFATTGTSQVFAAVDASPLAIGAARIVLGGGILGIVALLGHARASRATRGTARIPGAAVIGILSLGAVGVVAYQPAFFAGTRANGVAIGTVLALGSAPVFTGLLDALVRRRLPALRWIVATAIALLGVVLVSGLAGGADAARLTPLGILSSLGAGASYAMYAIASKLLLDRGRSSTATMGGVFGGAAILSIPLLMSSPLGWLTTTPGILLALWLGVVTTAVAYLLFGWGLARLAPTTVVTLGLAEPLGATLLGVFALHEKLTIESTLGLLIIVAGLVIMSLPARSRRSP